LSEFVPVFCCCGAPIRQQSKVKPNPWPAICELNHDLLATKSRIQGFGTSGMTKMDERSSACRASSG
jgi:hypothetical protein